MQSGQANNSILFMQYRVCCYKCGVHNNSYDFEFQASDAWNERISEKHGRWILDDSDEYANHYHCSICGAEKDTCNEIYYEPPPNYCEHCGTKMDGKDGEDDGR